MKVYIIRHGLTELNKQKKVNGQIDEPLSPEGIEQAKAGISLLPKTIKYIYTSPFLRARQTAEIINSKLKRPIFVEQGVTEIHMGSLAGNSWEEMESGLKLKKKHRSAQFNYHPFGGESAAEVKKRVISFLRKINNKHSDYEILIVTHGGIFRLMYLLENKEQLTDEVVAQVSPKIFDLDKILKRSNLYFFQNFIQHYP